MTAKERLMSETDLTRQARDEAERRWRWPGRENGLTYPSEAVRAFKRGAFIAGAKWAHAALSAELAEAKAEVERLRGIELEVGGLLRQMATPPPGWFTLGTHIDPATGRRLDVELEFWGDDGGVPFWERPAVRETDSERLTAEHDALKAKLDEYANAISEGLASSPEHEVRKDPELLFAVVTTEGFPHGLQCTHCGVAITDGQPFVEHIAHIWASGISLGHLACTYCPCEETPEVRG